MKIEELELEDWMRPDVDDGEGAGELLGSTQQRTTHREIAALT